MSNMLLHLSLVALQDGDRFWKLPECYIRGTNIKYLRIPEEVIDMVNEEELERQRSAASRGRGRGRFGGRGRSERGRGGRGYRGGRGGRGRGNASRK